jgi:hypothetical protein
VRFGQNLEAYILGPVTPSLATGVQPADQLEVEMKAKGDDLLLDLASTVSTGTFFACARETIASHLALAT